MHRGAELTVRYVESDADRRILIRYLEGQKLPLVVSVARGSKRTLKQNKLQRQWMNEIAEQLADRTAEEVRGECKLMFGVPILRAEHDDFRAAYDRHIRGLPYAQKLALMMEPFDFGVTRLMTTKQHTNYLDQIHRHFTEQGIVLTDPGDLLAAADAAASDRRAA